MPATENSRLPLADPSAVEDPVVRAVFTEIESELGFGIVPNVFRSMAIRPPILRATWDLFRATILQGVLPRAVKEMIGVVISEANDSQYALKVHLHSLGVQGVPPETLRGLASGSATATGLAPSVTAMLKVASVAIRQGSLAVTDGDIRFLREEGVTAEELGEFVATINLFRYVNSFTDLARVPIDAI